MHRQFTKTYGVSNGILYFNLDDNFNYDLDGDKCFNNQMLSARQKEKIDLLTSRRKLELQEISKLYLEKFESV